jgi:hypothetical protein
MGTLLNSILGFFGKEKQAPAESLKAPQDLNCPYGCGFVFPEMPSRRKKCPKCKMPVYLPRLPFEKEKTLLTEKDGINATIENEALRILLRFEVSTEKRLKKERGESGSQTFLLDRASLFLNNEIERCKNSQAYSALESFCNEQANLFRTMEKDCEDTLRLYFWAQLMALKSAGFRRVEISMTDEKEELVGKILSIDSALKTMPLPCCPDCRCIYSVKV